MGTDSVPVFWLHPAHPYFRWVFLCLLCFLTFGSYWCYDIPGALELVLEPRLRIGDSKFGLLYGIYNFMNIGIVLVGGYFIDKIGLRVGAILFCFFIALGQVIVSIGVSLDNPSTAFAIMLVGRAVFSIGGESLSVAQSTFCSKWFKGKDLALSFGITLSFARLGSFANFYFTPILADGISVPFAFWFGTVTCAVSFTITILASISDRVRDRYVVAEEISAATPFNIRDVRYFPASLWILYLICVFFYIGLFTLISIAGQGYMQVEFGFDPKHIGTILGVPYMISAALSPFMGYGVDKIGGKPYMLFISSLIMSSSYAVLLWAPHTEVWSPFSFTMYLAPLMAMTMMGLAYTLCNASLWPCVPLLVEDRMVGTAYGIMNSIQNAGLTLASVGVGYLSCADKVPHCVRPPLLLLMGVGVFTTICTVLLILADAKNGGVLSAKFVKVAEPSEGSESDPLLINKEK